MNPRGPSGEFYTPILFNLADSASVSSGRSEMLRYDSAAWNGFILASFVAEAGDYWGGQIRYAGEHQGFRLAGALGYERINDCVTPAAFVGNPPTAGPGGSPGGYCVGGEPDITVWGIALSAMHAPTGLFAQGHYYEVEYGNPAAAATLYYGQTVTNKADATQWLIQAGISKNWFGYGNTSVYGEYGAADDWGAGRGTGRDYAAPAGSVGFTPIFDVTGTTTTIWGFGIAQRFDAAATDLYLGYRNFEFDITGALADGGAQQKIPTKDIDMIVMGARVLF